MSRRSTRNEAVRASHGTWRTRRGLAWGGVWIGWFLAAGGMGAAEPPAALFKVYLESTVVRDSGPVTNVVWVVEAAGTTNRFQFVPVPGWHVRVNTAERRLELLDSEGHGAILVRYDGLTEGMSPETARELALSRHTGFEVTGELTLGSGCGVARAVDLLNGERSAKALARRVAYAWTGSGILEWTLSTSLRSFREHQADFGRFLVGFRRLSAPGTPGSTDATVLER
jgi:hypothetical protein